MTKTRNLRTCSIPLETEQKVARDPRAEDFEAFYQSWFPRALAIARKGGLSDPEAAAQEIMIVFWRTDYRERHDPTKGASFDTWVGKILYDRITSMQRRELRRRSIAEIEAIGERDFEWLEGQYGDLKVRLKAASEIIRVRYPEHYSLWRSVVFQVIVGNATAGHKIPRRELAARAKMTQAQLEEKLDEFIATVQMDEELCDLLNVDRAPLSA